MSDEADKESRTEDASERKLQKAHERGDAPVSREASVFAGFAAIAMVFLSLSLWIGRRVSGVAATLFDGLGDARFFTVGDARELLAMSGAQIGLALAPALGIVAIAGVLATALQNPPRFVADRIKPDISRLSFSKGVDRLFGLRGVTEFAKTVVKLLLALGVSSLVLWRASTAIAEASAYEAASAPEIMTRIATKIVLAFVALSGLVFAADLGWSRFQWRRDQRMTKQEVRDEHKENEGDPLVKARLRALAQQRSRKRMMAAVPRATMVIANPTHYAVAVRYVRAEGGAPVVLAKGVDVMALKIRQLAEQHNIPVVEDRALARSMYDAVSVEQMIPPAFYRAVAEIIHMLSSTKTRSLA